MAKGILIGIVLTLAAGLAGAYLFISLGLMPANADSPPSFLEKWMAQTSLRAALNKDAPSTPNPVVLNDENLISGIQLYAVNCAVCHGASDGKASNIAMGLYQHAPQFVQHGVEDDPDGKIYWKIKHGIRLTGMPSFGGTLSENELWQLTLFLKHMDSLPPASGKVWQAVPSSASKS
jgi:mono/diheme cytochrome c family protein